MNYLAHSILSHGFDDILIGNFIADSIKGGQTWTLQRKGIQQGIILHRKIDAYTDAHPAFIRSRKRLQARHGHYSPVIVDIIYDHFLALDFERYSELDLESFTHRVYDLLLANDDILPSKTRLILPYMRKDNWLMNYGNMDGIGKAFAGLARRARFPNRVEEAACDLSREYEAFRQDFHDCFGDLRPRTIEWLETGSLDVRK